VLSLDMGAPKVLNGLRDGSELIVKAINEAAIPVGQTMTLSTYHWERGPPNIFRPIYAAVEHGSSMRIGPYSNSLSWPNSR